MPFALEKKALLFTQRQIRPVRYERLCRGQNKSDSKNALLVLGKGENIVGKGQNAGSKVFSKGFYFRAVKSRDCVVKS